PARRGAGRVRRGRAAGVRPRHAAVRAGPRAGRRTARSSAAHHRARRPLEEGLMTHAPTRPATGFVLPLGAVGRDDLATAGGKGANLGELIRAGFPVPDGVVVTTDAYAAVVEHARLAPAVAAATDDGGTALHDAFAAVEIPAELRTAILDAYALLGGGPVAVRSSATAEDLPG